MKKKNVKKVCLVISASIMFLFLALPVQAATLSTETLENAKTTLDTQKIALPPSISHTEIISPMDVSPDWTESTQFRTNTSSFFINLETATVYAAILYLFKINPGISFVSGVAYAYRDYWGGVNGSHTGYMTVYYYWRPSGDPYSPYYIMKHINYYADSSHTKYLVSTDEYYYSTVPY